MKQCKILKFEMETTFAEEEREINQYLKAGYEIKAVFLTRDWGRAVYLERNI